MRTKLSAFFLCVGLATIAIAGPNVPETERISGLINKLGSANYRERMDAFRALDTIGEAALERLKSAAASADTETAHRANELVKRIEYRIMSARILTPTMVELDLKDAPVGDAIREFSLKTGLNVALAGNLSNINKERKVTYQSGRVTVWEALNGFCKAANLSEWNGTKSFPGLSETTAGAADALGNPIILPQGRVVFRSSVRRTGNTAAEQLYLFDTVQTQLPTSATGAVRVRALPVGSSLPMITADSDEIVIPLQVTLEPRLNWSAPPSVKIGSATDDRDQRLIASVMNLTANAPVDDEMFFINNMMIGNSFGAGFMPQRSHYVALRLRKGEQPTRMLKELNGTLTLPLRVNGVLVAVDSPLKSIGQTVRGNYGSMTIHAAERNDKGEVKVDVSLEMAPDVMNFTGLNRVVAMQNVQVQVQGAAIVQNISGGPANLPGSQTDYMGLALSDETGKRFNVAQVLQHQSTMGGADGTKLRLSLVFRPGKEVGEATRLSFTGSHPASVETEFHFADLTLP